MSYVNIGGPEKIDDWGDFRWAWESFDRGSFAAVAIIGKQGSGKTSLATSILLRRAYSIWRYYGELDTPVAPNENDFNPFANETITFHGEQTEMWRLSVATALKYRVLSPHDLVNLLLTTNEPTPFGLIIDEAPLWSRDVVSWWLGKRKSREKPSATAAGKLAIEFARRFATVVRGLTTYLMVLAHTVSLIPSAIRVPIDVVIDVEGFRKIGWFGEPGRQVLQGIVRGSVKIRQTKGVRSPRTESMYYTIAYFELPVYMARYLLEYDLEVKRKRGLLDFFMERGMLKGKRTTLMKLGAMIESGEIELTSVAPNVAKLMLKDRKGLPPLAVLSTWIRDALSIVKDVKPNKSQTEATIYCYEFVENCANEVAKSLQAIAATGKKKRNEGSAT